jgi:hypothetical protein
MLDKIPQEHVTVIAEMQEELKNTQIYKIVSQKWTDSKLAGKNITSTDEHHIRQITLALLVSLAGRLDTSNNTPLLRDEISRLSTNLQQLTNTCMNDFGSGTTGSSCKNECKSNM